MFVLGFGMQIMKYEYNFFLFGSNSNLVITFNNNRRLNTYHMGAQYFGVGRNISQILYSDSLVYVSLGKLLLRHPI